MSRFLYMKLIMFIYNMRMNVNNEINSGYNNNERLKYKYCEFNIDKNNNKNNISF